MIPRPAVWEPGRAAPWSHLDTNDRVVSLPRVREVFGGRRGEPSPVAVTGGTPSAVLVALYESDSGLSVVLTRRSWSLRTHRGEVSFPGGRADPGEDAPTTALREAQEEVGLDPATVEVVGEMDHLTTVTRRAYITPIVALAQPLPDLRPDPREVDAILHVTLDELTGPDTFREERWGAGPSSRPLYFFDIAGDTVWGATASMLRQLMVMLLALPTGVPEDYDAARGVGPWDPFPSGFADDVV